MKHCSSCNCDFEDKMTECPFCHQELVEIKNPKFSVLIFLMSLIFPYVGLFYALIVNKKNKVKTTSAIIGGILGTVLYVLIFFLTK